jgi:chromosome segregation ATPase
MENNQNGAVNNRVYGSIIVVLLLINSFTFYQLFIENTKKVDVTSQKAVLEHQFKDLSDTLFVRSNELNLFKGKTAELDQAIADKQEQLDREKKLIQNLFAKAKLSQAELSKARNLIVQYQNSIADLGSQIAALTKQNQELMAANGQLNTDLSLERSIAVKLTEQNKGLAKKVELGSLLPLAKMDVESYPQSKQR